MEIAGDFQDVIEVTRRGKNLEDHPLFCFFSSITKPIIKGLTF